MEEADRVDAKELDLLAKRNGVRRAGAVAAVADPMRMEATFSLLSF